MRGGYGLCLKIAKGSNAKYQFGAVVVSSGRVLGLATNLRPITDCTKGRHAEAGAIGRAKKSGKKMTGATIYVARLRKRLSRPCGACMKKIRAVGIDSVCYYEQDQTFKVVKV